MCRVCPDLRAVASGGAALTRGTHELRTVGPGDGTVTVTGRHLGAAGAVEFTDVFTLSACGLIRTHHRVHR